MSVKKVILVFKTHFDIGFTQLSREILEYYKSRMMEDVETTCRVTEKMGQQKYVWTMPAWPLLWIRTHSDAQQAARIDALVRNGQLVWHALPYTSHYDFSGIEDAIHGFSYARELSRFYGLPFRRAAKMTDVPGFGWFLPELLAGAGIDFLHLGSNLFAAVPDVPLLFWWEAPSGKRVLTMYNQGYGSSLLPPDSWSLDTWLALMSTNDNTGPQTAGIVQQYVSKIRAKLPDAEIVCGTLDDFRDALFSNDLSSLPVMSCDLADTWIHGVASYPRESALIRRLRGRLMHVEQAAAQCMDPAHRHWAAGEIRQAWDEMAMFSEHTWGLDVKTQLGAIPDYDDFEAFRHSSPKCARMEESWREQTQRAENAARICENLEARLGLAPLPATADQRFLPGSGERVLENDCFRVLYSADTGVVHTVIDLRHGCEILKERNGTGVFFYRYDVYSADELTEFLRAYGRRFTDWGVLDYGRADYPENQHVTRIPKFVGGDCAPHEVRLRYRTAEDEHYGDAAEIIITLSLPAGDAPLRVKVALSGKRATPYVESAALCMPLAAENPAYVLNKTGCVLRPETEIAAGANHVFYAMEHFVAADDGRALLGVVSHDCTLVSFGENGVFRYRRTWQPTDPEFRFCLFNNMWGTNFPQWIEGDMSFEFDILAMDTGDVCKLYREASRLAANPDNRPEPVLPFTLSGPLRVTKLAPLEEGILLRVQNCSSEPCRASVARLGWRMTPADLLGQPLGDAVQDTAECCLGPFGLQTYLCRPISD